MYYIIIYIYITMVVIPNSCILMPVNLTISIDGWWYTYLSEKYEFVICDDEVPNTVYRNPNVLQGTHGKHGKKTN